MSIGKQLHQLVPMVGVSGVKSSFFERCSNRGGAMKPFSFDAIISDNNDSRYNLKPLA